MFLCHTLQPVSVIFRNQAVRSYTSPPPPQAGQQSPKTKGNDTNSNTLLFAALGVVAAAGAYYYFSNPEDIEAVKEKAQRNQQEMEQKAREAVQVGKARADDAYRQSQARYDATKVCEEICIEGALIIPHRSNFLQTAGQDKIHEVEEKARQAATDTQEKLDSYRKTSGKAMTDARVLTENLYKDTRSAAEGQVDQAQSTIDKKAKEAKSGWFSWLGWGKSTTEEVKKDVAGKVAESAEDVKKQAEKNA
ncbi:hypothetical protein C0989_010801 [Termitomyces sp. Mn162]|nr:hypothetical protein C0989_010801 [Termitomyces sp. Mn162]